MFDTETSKLSLIIRNNNKAETILLLHGGPGVPDYLEEAADIFGKKFNTIRFDQRGVGSSISKNGSYKIEEYLSDINSILEQLKIDQVHIFGHSWGGLLAQLWAVKNQNKVKSLFLCSSSSGTGEVWEMMEKEVMEYNRRKASSVEWAKMGLNSIFGIMGFNFGYRNIFRLVWKYYFRDPEQAPNAGKSWLQGINAKAVIKTRKDIVKTGIKEFEESFAHFNIPVMITFGNYDIYGESKNFIRKRLPDSTFIEFENAGHLPWIQDKNAFISVINKFYNNICNNN